MSPTDYPIVKTGLVVSVGKGAKNEVDTDNASGGEQGLISVHLKFAVSFYPLAVVAVIV